MEVTPFRKIHPSSLMQFGSFGRLVVVSDRSNFDISEGRNPQAGMTGLGTFENFWLMPFGFVWKCGIPQKWPHEWEHMYDKPCRSEVPHCRTNPFWEPRTVTYYVQPWWPATHLRVCHHALWDPKLVSFFSGGSARLADYVPLPR